MTPTVAFFSDRVGLGQTTLVHHLAHMLVSLRARVVMIDFDPQCGLSLMCLEPRRREELWPTNGWRPQTLCGYLLPEPFKIVEHREPHVEPVVEGLGLVVGDMTLSMFESVLSATAWASEPAINGPELSTILRNLTARAAETHRADVVLVDIGPGLGGLNHAALNSVDHMVIPLGSDLLSLVALSHLGPNLRKWRRDSASSVLGYVRMQKPARHRGSDSGPYYDHRRLEEDFLRAVVGDVSGTVGDHSFELGTMHHYPSLIALAEDAGKPMFALKPSDGAIGAHGKAVLQCRNDVYALANALLQRVLPDFEPGS
jgi:chromosome partitioning protein